MKNFSALLLTMLLSHQVMARGEKGHGGGAFVCRNANGGIISAELVDFYEGKTEYNLAIKQSPSEIEDQVNRAVMKYMSATGGNNEFLQSVQDVQAIMNIASNAVLENTNDFNLRVAPKTCVGGKITFEQLANYTDDGKLTVDQEIYDTLSNTAKAGLIIHEASYLLARKWHDSLSSREARRLTAYLFSSTPASAIPKDVSAMTLIDSNSNKKWLCSILMVSAKYEEKNIGYGRGVENCNGNCLIKSDIKKQILSFYGSTMFKAEEAVITAANEWMRRSTSSTHKLYNSYCGADSSTKISEILELYTRYEVDSVIDCSRSWSPVFDCKEIK